MKRSAIAVLMATLIMLSFVGSILYVHGADPSSWYMTVEGVLDTDTYALYPFETDESLTIGFSQFGELIDSSTNVGLEYGLVDPFAPAAGSAETLDVPKVLWIQGWLINITYVDKLKGPRNVWAAAMHSDAYSYGGPWLRVDFDGDYSTTYFFEDPRDPGYIIDEDPYMASGLQRGGRKTNGTAVTEPIRVLYDGPRKFIALLETTIYDHGDYLTGSTTNDLALVKVSFTIVFNKVKKEVNVLKDVKSLITEKFAEKIKVQFSNRGEVDLGTEGSLFSSYAHFYVDGNGEGFPTVYDDDWTLVRTEHPEETDYEGYSMAGPYPQEGMATFDVAQAINPTAKYVWWAAFWPSLSDWSIDGWDQWWQSLDVNDPHYVDHRIPAEEPFIPFYIGEWDFVLYHVADPFMRTQFRGVTQYGVVDLHDADDADTGGENIIDSETCYYLDEKFNPWDLFKAVHKKDTSRLVWFEDGPITKGTKINCGDHLDMFPIFESDWDAYCSFAERILLLPDGTLLERGTDYTVVDNGMNITVLITVDADETLKILWSTHFDYDWGIVYEREPIYTFPVTARWEWVVVGREAASVDSAGAALVSAAFKNKGIEIGTSGIDMEDPEIANSIPWVMAKFDEGDMWTDYYYDYTGGDHRAALKDDWCTTWAVASSNIIGVGGPLRNLVSYYGNCFTDAFFGLAPYAGDEIWAGEIAASTCWNKYSYASSETEGYAVITTYKDINGTVLFLVWGHWGRDTYYATRWLYGGLPCMEPPGIIQLQEAPDGLTSIILEIDYEDPDHPEFTIEECLGTISEIEWEHYEETKGGIHDP